jgi:hypothetical protein
MSTYFVKPTDYSFDANAEGNPLSLARVAKGVIGRSHYL